jgi:lambda family phage portal protein
MFGWLKSVRNARKNEALAQAFSQELRAKAMGRILARFDVAQTTDENYRLWENTDYLSSKSANDSQTRRTARIRCRYEVQNNSYARGITLTLANDLVGTGPRLQVRTKVEAANKQVQAAFMRWLADISLAEKLRTMKLAKVQDGEVFGQFVTNYQLANSVQLDIKVIETDQVATPMTGFQKNNWVDGVELDDMGEPAVYHVLKQHPGDLYLGLMNPLAFDRVPKRNILHWFRKDRPGQVRGMPEIAPSIHLFAKLRMFTKSVMTAAESAADLAVLLQSEYQGDQAATPTAFDSVNLERGMMTTLPAGLTASGFKPEQPATTYEMFVRLILREIARCLNVPFNVAAGDSSSFNYSSGRLDHLSYHRQLYVERAHLEILLDRIFYAWLEEAVMVPGLIPDGFDVDTVPHRWFWDGLESIDPEKDSAADASDLDNNTKTLEEICAGNGDDWEEVIRQRGIERKRLEAEGLLSTENAQTQPTNGRNLTRKDVRQIAEAMREMAGVST